MLQNGDIQALIGFGLTFLQSKVYLTLVKTGTTNIRNIAEATNMARQEVQRVTGELQNLGLVEKVLVNPTEFHPIAIEDALSFLLERQERTIQELRANADKLLENYRNKQSETLTKEKTLFVITTGKEAIIKKSRAIVERITETCDIVNGCWKNIGYASAIYKQENIQALKRNVRIRIVAEELPKEQRAKEIYRHSIGNPLFEIKFFASPLPAMMGIYDKKELLVFTSPEKLIGDSPMMWTNNSALIAAAQVYFDKLWKQSRPQKNSKRSQRLEKRLQQAQDKKINVQTAVTATTA